VKEEVEYSKVLNKEFTTQSMTPFIFPKFYLNFNEAKEAIQEMRIISNSVKYINKIAKNFTESSISLIMDKSNTQILTSI